MSGIGELRERLALYAPEHVPDNAGGYAETWRLAQEVWARATPLPGGEAVAADRLSSPEKHRLEVRAPNPAQAGWRVFWRARWHRIDSVQAGERLGDFTILLITEIVG